MTDSIVESVRDKFKSRANVGKSKYGVTMDRTDLSTVEWLIHAQEEAMDLVVYLEKVIQLMRSNEQGNAPRDGASKGKAI